MDTGRLLTVAFAVAPRLPESLVRALLWVAAEVSWLSRSSGVRRLEENLARVVPSADRAELRHLSRAGMRSYMRYYAETLILPGLSGAQIDARVRLVNDGWLRERFAQGKSVVGALGHTGNWDLAAAWVVRNVAPVTTVAERLEPEQLFLNFLKLREARGLTIIPLGRDEGSSVFRRLVEATTNGPVLVPLLADRDLTSHGMEVSLFGQTARVAAGPAALTAGGRIPLVAVSISYERLRGVARRTAGSRWGLVVEFSDPVTVDESITGRDRVVALTQAWVDVMGAGIRRHPTDWHMLQRLFVADLDQTRYAASVQDSQP